MFDDFQNNSHVVNWISTQSLMSSEIITNKKIWRKKCQIFSILASSRCETRSFTALIHVQVYLEFVFYLLVFIWTRWYDACKPDYFVHSRFLERFGLYQIRCEWKWPNILYNTLLEYCISYVYNKVLFSRFKDSIP